MSSLSEISPHYHTICKCGGDVIALMFLYSEVVGFTESVHKVFSMLKRVEINIFNHQSYLQNSSVEDFLPSKRVKY